MVVPSGFVAVVVSGVLVSCGGCFRSLRELPDMSTSEGEGGHGKTHVVREVRMRTRESKKSRNFVDIRSGRSLCIGVELAQAHRFTLALARCPVVSVRDSDGLPPILDPELQEAWSRI